MKFKRKPEIRDWISLTVLLVLALLFSRIAYLYMNAFGGASTGGLAASAKSLQEFILSYGNTGRLVLILFHALHVIISVIPSVIVQFAGGLLYGVSAGMITGILGIALGTFISFYLSRIFGRRALTLFVSEKAVAKMEALASKDASGPVLFLLFLLPVPKDFLAYFVGLTGMNALKFFLISATGRLPGMLVATYLGARVSEGKFAAAVAVSVFCGLLFLALYLFRKKLLRLVSR